MSDTTIRLDRSRPSSSCHGDRTPQDPHYGVHFWQGTKVGNKNVLLPFDSQGILVPDDGKTASFNGIVEGKEVTFQPLYDADMRALVEQKKKRLSGAKNSAEPDDAAEASQPAAQPADDDVNLVAYLRGEVKYSLTKIKVAVKNRYHLNQQDLGEIVRFLVLDQRLVGEDEVAKGLAVHIPKQAA